MPRQFLFFSIRSFTNQMSLFLVAVGVSRSKNNNADQESQSLNLKFRDIEIYLHSRFTDIVVDAFNVCLVFRRSLLSYSRYNSISTMTSNLFISSKSPSSNTIFQVVCHYLLPSVSFAMTTPLFFSCYGPQKILSHQTIQRFYYQHQDSESRLHFNPYGRDPS